MSFYSSLRSVLTSGQSTSAWSTQVRSARGTSSPRTLPITKSTRMMIKKFRCSGRRWRTNSTWLAVAVCSSISWWSNHYSSFAVVARRASGFWSRLIHCRGSRPQWSILRLRCSGKPSGTGLLSRGRFMRQILLFTGNSINKCGKLSAVPVIYLWVRAPSTPIETIAVLVAKVPWWTIQINYFYSRIWVKSCINKTSSSSQRTTMTTLLMLSSNKSKMLVHQ